jgi:hypothetical protein
MGPQILKVVKKVSNLTVGSAGAGTDDSLGFYGEGTDLKVMTSDVMNLCIDITASLL